VGKGKEEAYAAGDREGRLLRALAGVKRLIFPAMSKKRKKDLRGRDKDEWQHWNGKEEGEAF